MAVIAAEVKDTNVENPNYSASDRYIVWQGQETAPAIVVSYKLSAIRTADGVKIYWTSNSVSLTDAPGGAGIYTAATLTEEGSWSPS